MKRIIISTAVLCSVTFAKPPLFERPRPFVFTIHRTDQLPLFDDAMLDRLVADEFGIIVLFGKFYANEAAGAPIPPTGYQWEDPVAVSLFVDRAHAKGFRVVQYAAPGPLSKAMGRYGAIGFIVVGGSVDGWFFDGLSFDDTYRTAELTADLTSIRQALPTAILIGHDDVPSPALWYVCDGGPWRQLLDYHLVGEVWAKPNSTECRGCPPLTGDNDPQLERWFADPTSIPIYKVEWANRCEPAGQSEAAICAMSKTLVKHGGFLWTNIQKEFLTAHETCILPAWREALP